MSRSRTGCWTCRIRKKKCDERHPTCARCQNLRIECQGYGAKRKSAEVLGHAIQAHRVAGIKSLRSANLGSLLQVWKPGKKQSRQAESQRAGSNWLSQQSPPRMPAIRQIDFNYATNKNDLDSQQRPDFHAFSNVGPPMSSDRATPYYSPNTTVLDPWKMWVDVNLPSFIDNRSGRSLRLLAEYFNKVFPLIGYFYQPHAADLGGSSGSSWLLILFQRSQPFYYSCLSMGLCHELLIASGGLAGRIDFSVELRWLHSLTLNGVQRRIDELVAAKDGGSPTEVVDLLASIWQLLSMEVWRTTEGYWGLHWDGMGKVLSTVAASKPNQSSSLFQPLTTTTPDCIRDPTCVEEALILAGSGWPPERAAFKFYLECYVWMDILATATIGNKLSRPCHFNYMHLLRDGKLQLRNLMGCHDWVMYTIKEISDLQSWSKRMLRLRRDILNSGKIKICSTQLEERLENGLVNLLEMRILLGQGLERDRSIVTEVYIHAALVYLHVVVFGAQVDAPRLRYRVSSALEALKATPERLLIRLSWAFGIVACMANIEEQEQFKDVLLRATEAGFWVGTVSKAMLLAEECWRLRGTQSSLSEGADWMDAMDSLGIKILLI